MAIKIKKPGLNGSHFFAMDKQMRARKLKGGPAIPGMKQPTIPIRRRMIPMIIRKAIRSSFSKLKGHSSEKDNVVLFNSLANRIIVIIIDKRKLQRQAFSYSC